MTVKTKVVEFLEARLDEDARLACFEQARMRDRGEVEVGPMTPTRLVAEVAAKRRIIAFYDMVSASKEFHSDGWVAAREAVFDVAAVYSDHPDFQSEWDRWR